jgi:putative membrane protein
MNVLVWTAALAERLKVTAKDNPVSRELLAGAEKEKARLRKLRGAEFDRAYLENELVYRRTVNGVPADRFIPNLQNPEVKKAFQGALAIFRGHEKHVAELVRGMQGM